MKILRSCESGWGIDFLLAYFCLKTRILGVVCGLRPPDGISGKHICYLSFTLPIVLFSTKKINNMI